MTGNELLAALVDHKRQNPKLMNQEIAVYVTHDVTGQQHIESVEIAPVFPDRPMAGALGLQIVATL